MELTPAEFDAYIAAQLAEGHSFTVSRVETVNGKTRLTPIGEMFPGDTLARPIAARKTRPTRARRRNRNAARI